MEGTEEPVVGIDWLAAAVAPWAVSPHPNFSRPHVTGPALLALVAEYRADEFDRNALEPAYQDRAWISLLVDAARSSLFTDTQANAIEVLTALSVDPELPIGARGAAALYASMALAESDDLESAPLVIDRCLDTLSTTGEGPAPSLALVRCALNLQAAMRWWELGSLDNVTARLDAFEASAQACPPGADFEDFEVSAGISWAADLVQADVSNALAWRALQLRSRLEGLGGTLWQQVVRTRPSWVDVRIDWTKAERDRRVIKAAFESETPGSLDRVVFGGETVPGVVAGYAAMWQAELGGDLAEALQCRESLAQLLLLQRDRFGAVEAIPEALRLMRRSSSKDGLRTAIAVARAEGPVNALVAGLNDVVRRPSFPQRVSTQDVRLIEGAVDLLAEGDVERVVEGLFGYLRFEHDQRHSYRDPSVPLSVLASLTNRFPSMSERIADETLDLLGAPSFHLLSVGREAAQLAKAIDWGRAGVGLHARWMAWANGLENDDSLKDLGESLRTVLEPQAESRLIAVDNPRALVRLINDPSAEWTSEQSLSAVALAQAEIDQAIAESTSGVRTFGSWDGPELAALVALTTSASHLWQALVAFLGRADVEADMKSGALGRLADKPSDVPASVAGQFVSAWPILSVQRPLDTPLSSDRSRYFPAALRFGARFQLESASYFISVATAMAADKQARARQHAGLLCRDVIDAFGAVTWGHAMLLNLSRDDDLSVRAGACRVLVEASIRHGELDGVVQARINELLSDDSIRVPLSTLHGFQVLATLDGGIEGFSVHAEAIRRLAEVHPSSTVRGAAENAIDAHAGASG